MESKSSQITIPCMLNVWQMASSMSQAQGGSSDDAFPQGNDASEGEAERNSQEDEIKQHETIEQKQQSQSGKKKKKKKTKNPGAKDATSAEEKEEEDLDKLLKSMNIQLVVPSSSVSFMHLLQFVTWNFTDLIASQRFRHKST